jgi:hypothetical protein
MVIRADAKALICYVQLTPALTRLQIEINIVNIIRALSVFAPESPRGFFQPRRPLLRLARSTSRPVQLCSISRPLPTTQKRTPHRYWRPISRNKERFVHRRNRDCGRRTWDHRKYFTTKPGLHLRSGWCGADGFPPESGHSARLWICCRCGGFCSGSHYYRALCRIDTGRQHCFYGDS